MDTTILWQLLLQAALIALNAFFAMSEIALLSLSPVRLRNKAEEGDKLSEKLLRLTQEPAGFLSTIQIGITLAGFLGSAFAADSFSEYIVAWIYEGIGFTALSVSALHTLSVIFITVVLSYFTLVFGELVPKRVAMQKPYAVARLAYGIIAGMAAVVKPVVWLLSASTNVVLRALRLRTEAEEESVTQEEIRMMAKLGEEKGTIDREEKEWIDNVFEFGDTTAREAMTHITEVVACSITDSAESIFERIRDSGLSRFPVYGNDPDDILGILNARTFLLQQNCASPRPLEELLQPAYFVPEALKADVLFQDMRRKKIHIAIVIDEYGKPCGVITMEDLLEEIVGNIYDEFDPSEQPEIEPLRENLWRISGSAGIKEIAETLGVVLPENQGYDTLGGLVFSCLHTIPQDGTALDVEIYGLHIRVKSIQKRKIETAEVWKL